MPNKPQDSQAAGEPQVRSSAVVRPPNGYDMAFLAWFRRCGWRIHRFIGSIDVWSNNDAVVHHKVTYGMIERLEAAGHIERIFPERSCLWDEWWGVPPNDQAQ